MQLFQNIDSNIFTYNGIKYVKNFMIIKQGDTNISVHNAYDTSFQLMVSTHYSQVKVNGVSYSNQANLMGALSTLIFAKQIVDTAGVLLTISGVTDTYTTGATYSDGTAVFTNNYDGTFSLSGLTDTLQNATDKNNTSTNSIRIIDAADENNFSELKKDELIIHTTTGGGVGIKADNSSEYYVLQAPAKTGDQIIATKEDIDSLNLQKVTDNGNTTTNDIYVNSLNIYNSGWDAYTNIYINDTTLVMTTPNNSALLYDTGVLTLENNNIYANFITNTNTENRSYTFPDNDGTIALRSDFGIIDLDTVTSNGNSTNNSISVDSVSLWDSANSNFGGTLSYNDGTILFNNSIDNTSIATIQKGGLGLINDSNKVTYFSNKNVSVNNQEFQLPIKSGSSYTIATTEDISTIPTPTLDTIIGAGNTIYNKAIKFNSPSGVVSLSGQSVTSSNAFVFPSKNPQSTPIILGTQLDDIVSGTFSAGILSLKNVSGTTVASVTIPDTYVTGGTHNQSTGISTFKNDQGNTFNVSGYSTGYTLTSSAITSTLGFTPSSADTNTYTTGGTYSNGTTIFTNNTGGTFSVTGYPTTISSSGITDLKTYTEVMQGRWIFSDMLYTSSIQPFVGGALSSGSILGGSEINDYVAGVNVLRSSTTANSGYNIYLNQAILGNLKGSEMFEMQMVHYNLSGTTTRFGFTANINATTDFTYGMYFEILDNQLYAKTANNSTRTSVLLGTVPSTTTYYAYRITVTSPSSINYSVYNATGGTAIYTTNITTNIPSTYTTYNNSMKVNVASFNSGTVLQNLCGIDYIKVYLGDTYNRGLIRI